MKPLTFLLTHLLTFSYSDDANAVLKLADFGLASIIHDKEMLHAACGTPGYVAPEVVAEISKKKNEDTTGRNQHIPTDSLTQQLTLLQDTGSQLICGVLVLSCIYFCVDFHHFMMMIPLNCFV